MIQAPDKKKQLFITGLMILICCSVQSQSLKEHLAKGDRSYQRKDYKNAIPDYLEALKFDAGDARTNLKLGIAYLHEENSGMAVQYLKKAHSLDPAVDPNIDYHLAMAYQKSQLYAQAMEHYTALKSKNKSLAAVANRKIRECALADSLMRIPSGATVELVAGEINTPFSETFPIASPDGKTLIFTSNRSADEYEIKSRNNYNDVYVSRKNGSAWGAPEKIGGEINVKLNESALSLSADQKTIFLYYEEGHGDIYTSTLEDGQWTRPTPLNRFINHPQYREGSACISADGKKLYFSSNRAGGRGGYDIYVSELGQNGQWGRPSNLGSTINTRGDEITPFLATDSVTIYFSSNGHATLGDTDIFRSTLKETGWTKPQHLGHPINTSGPDEYFVLSPDGRTGFYSRRNDNATDNIDIFAVQFNGSVEEVTNASARQTAMSDAPGTENRPRNGAAILKGSVADVTTQQPLDATLRLVNNATRQVIAVIQTKDAGSFELVIPQGGNYGIITEKQGYLFSSMNFNIPPSTKHREVETRILMVKADVGSKVVLKNIFFDVNRAVLKPESQTELQNIRDLLLQNPGWRIQINGHTDNVGDESANIALSLRRAEAVVHYLISQGIAHERVQAKGYGSAQPLVSNDDETEGRQINRRTEIEIIQ